MQAAAAGTVRRCAFDSQGGNYLVIDHGNGHRTRYLHLLAPPIPSDGQGVIRGQLVGYEGSTGTTIPPGFVHLHFETRHGATGLVCDTGTQSGTAVNPYASNTYIWTDIASPAYPAVSCYQPVDSATGSGQWPGVFRPKPDGTWWHERYSNTNGIANRSFKFAVGVFRTSNGNANWLLKNSLSGGSADVNFNFGLMSDKPITGDWQ